MDPLITPISSSQKVSINNEPILSKPHYPSASQDNDTFSSKEQPSSQNNKNILTTQQPLLGESKPMSNWQKLSQRVQEGNKNIPLAESHLSNVSQHTSNWQKLSQRIQEGNKNVLLPSALQGNDTFSSKEQPSSQNNKNIPTTQQPLPGDSKPMSNWQKLSQRVQEGNKNIPLAESHLFTAAQHTSNSQKLSQRIQEGNKNVLLTESHLFNTSNNTSNWQKLSQRMQAGNKNVGPTDLNVVMNSQKQSNNLNPKVIQEPELFSKLVKLNTLETQTAPKSQSNSTTPPETHALNSSSKPPRIEENPGWWELAYKSYKGDRSPEVLAFQQKNRDIFGPEAVAFGEGIQKIHSPALGKAGLFFMAANPAIRAGKNAYQFYQAYKNFQHDKPENTIEIRDKEVKNFGKGFPERELPRCPKTKEPIPDTGFENTWHSQLGTRKGSQGIYPKAREFAPNNKVIREIEGTNHGRSDHPNPHQHRYIPNETGGNLKRGPTEPIDDSLVNLPETLKDSLLMNPKSFK
ncbi:MAG: rhs family protein [Francisellaceae bacterium]|nr:rhs family protein [Francisellaceae bacterium]